MDPPPKLNREKFTLFILYIFMVGSLVYDVTYGRYHLRLYFKAVRRTEGVSGNTYAVPVHIRELLISKDATRNRYFILFKVAPWSVRTLCHSHAGTFIP